MGGAQSKAINSRQKRPRKRRVKRIDVVAHDRDVAVIRDVPAARDVLGRPAKPSIADVLRALPDVSGPEFDSTFEEIDRLRQHSIAAQARRPR
jgi:hypothetical protein